jgi:lipopolysaccharide transport system permease protein
MNGFRMIVSVRSATYLADLLCVLIARDVKVRYKRSVLGMGWSLMNPLLHLAILYVVFQLVLPLGIRHYPLYLFTGILVWNWFQTSVLAASGTIVENASLIKQPGFPSAVLPLAAVCTHLINFLMALPIVFVFLLVERLPLTPAASLLPVIIVLQAMFTVSVAYVPAALYAPFRDVQYLLGVALTLGFYLVPVFYEASNLPPGVRWVYRFNPMVLLMDAYRSVLIAGKWPDAGELAVVAAISGGLLLLTRALFLRFSRDFVEHL